MGLGKFTLSAGDAGDDNDYDEDDDEVHLKCWGVEKNVGGLGDVRSMHAVVVRHVLVTIKMTVSSSQKMIECVL